MASQLARLLVKTENKTMINEIHTDANSRMGKSLISLETDFSKIRAGRAHPSLLDQITVEYYGSMVPLSQVSNVSAELLRFHPGKKIWLGQLKKLL
jgi:ribosome recycling factor